MIGKSGEMKCRLPVGAEVQAGGGVLFRVWAPKPERVTLLVGELEDLAGAIEVPLDAETGGYWSRFVEEAKPGMYYRFLIAGAAYPDPISRFQPAGPHGSSQIVDPDAFR